MTTCGLRDIWHDLHATRNNASRGTTASGISRSCSASEAVRQLLHQGAAHVISGNVNGICDTQDDQRTLGGERETRIGSVQTSAGGFLNLTDADAGLAYYGTNKDVGDEKTKGICLGLGGRRSVQRLRVQGADDEAKSLGRGSEGGHG